MNREDQFLNRNEIIKMAREAGFLPEANPVMPQLLERFAALVAEHEREACLDACDRLTMYGPVAEAQQRYNQAYGHCKDAIRARGETK